jgi:lysophospholipase L1-like esterase
MVIWRRRAIACISRRPAGSRKLISMNPTPTRGSRGCAAEKIDSHQYTRRDFLREGTLVAAGLAAGMSARLADASAEIPPVNNEHMKRPTTMIREDYRSEPVRRMVVMGESNAYGMNASCPRNEWVQVLGDGIREFQEEPVRVFNNAIHSNVISPDAPGYDATSNPGTAPSALERFEADMIAYRPDLAVFAYGLNDSRCGHTLESFIRAYRVIVSTTRKRLPNALVVLAGPYWNLQYDANAWEKNKGDSSRFGKFGLPGDKLVLAYNQAIAQLASETHSLFVDLYRVLEGTPWLLTADACHFNDLGHRIIGLTVFSQLATHCSFLSQKSLKIEKALGSNIHNTGGTEALPHVIQKWRPMDRWKR